MANVAFVYSDDFLGYQFNRTHPLKQVRLQMNYRLLEAFSVFTDGTCDLVQPIPATDSDLLTVHTPAYVNALHDLSDGKPILDRELYGFGVGDNPSFPGMYEATLLYVGATKEAVKRIISGESPRAFNSSGGLHHAMPSRAAGFCLANDCALAAHWLRDAGHKVVYIDIDAHHGDGVQQIFYDDPSVLTISLHETPLTLFPRVSGFVHEVGHGKGTGYNVNIPMLAGSTDSHYQFAFREIVNPLVQAFGATAVVLQVGADGHFDDPLAHLSLSSHGWLDMVREVIGYGLPIVALGGGGYNLKTVARLWTLLVSELASQELSDVVPDHMAKEYNITHLHDCLPAGVTSIQIDNSWRDLREVKQFIVDHVFPIHGLSVRPGGSTGC